MDTFTAVILALLLVPVFGTVAGMIREEQESRRIAQVGACPACEHPEHPMVCLAIVGPRTTCECDWMTDPDGQD